MKALATTAENSFLPAIHAQEGAFSVPIRRFHRHFNRFAPSFVTKYEGVGDPLYRELDDATLEFSINESKIISYDDRDGTMLVVLDGGVCGVFTAHSELDIADRMAERCGQEKAEL